MDVILRVFSPYRIVRFRAKSFRFRGKLIRSHENWPQRLRFAIIKGKYNYDSRNGKEKKNVTNFTANKSRILTPRSRVDGFESEEENRGDRREQKEDFTKHYERLFMYFVTNLTNEEP